MSNVLIQISGIILITGLLLAAFVSWGILLRKKFKTWYIMPQNTNVDPEKGKSWFLLQSVVLFAAGFIVWLRMDQLLVGHTDNVIEQLIWAVSGMLFVRAMGEFKVMGLFRTQDRGDFTHLDKRLLTPFALILFVLSWPLI
ncbi:MAG: DUF3995 domain-containing protein [Bacteroidales bacterium]|jgi:hypothetical protein|nr:DUF3995 domain-containing protein [Bacteroidales bacterium]HOI31672.1 DUF3995 domain-containing protein [Bacteroidales bacterium]